MQIDSAGETFKTPWVDFALGKLSVREIPGPPSNKEILEFFAHTSGGVPVAGDETAWCAAFAGCCLIKSGYQSTRSKAARSYARYGTELQAYRFGAIYVFDRSDPTNPNAAHVAFCLGEYPAKNIAFMLGGNQGNAVSIKPYSLEKLIARRWPIAQAA